MIKKAYKVLFVIVLSLSFLGIVKADTTIEFSRAMSGQNGVIYFGSTDAPYGIIRLTCGGKLLGSTPQEVATGVYMSTEGGQYKIETMGLKGGSTQKITCDYDNAPYYMTDQGTAGKGKLTVNLSISDDEVRNFDYNFDLNYFSNKEKRITGDNTPFSIFEKGGFEYDGCEFDDTYLTCGRTYTGTLIRLKEGLTIDEPIMTDVTVTFRKKIEGTEEYEEYKIFAHVTINGKTLIIADFGGAKCDSWPSGWKKYSGNASEIKNTATKMEYEYSGGTIPVPSCTYKGTDGLVYTFKGWYVHDRTDDGNTTVPSGVCAEKGATMGPIDYSTNNKSLQYERFIYTCFEEVGSVVVSLDGAPADLASGSGYTKISGSGFDKQYRKTVDKNGKVALPSVKFSNANNQFKCWRNSSDSGKCYKEGESVGEGYYSLEFTTDTKYEKEDEVTDYKKMVVGTTEILNPESIVSKVTNCSSADGTVITATFDAEKGVCTVSANKVSSKYVTVTVNGTTDKGVNKKINMKIKVAANSADDDEGNVYSAYTGETYDVTGFLSNSQEDLNNCTNYAIKPVYTTVSEKLNLYKVIEKMTFVGVGGKVIHDVPLNDNIYNGEVTCNGKTVKIAAVCMDPSRQEPKSKHGGSNYSLDHYTTADGSYVDKLTIVIYNDESYQKVIDNVANNNIGETERMMMASATAAYRILAIKVGESAFDDDAGLSEQYYAYKALVKNIDSKWGNSVDKWVKASKNLKDSDITDSYVTNLFCPTNTNTKTKCENPNKAVLKKVVKLLRDALNYDKSNKKIQVSAYIAKEDTDVSTDGTYTKIIEGKFTNIPTDTATISDHFLSIKPSCKKCAQYINAGALSVSFQIGRDLQHLVNFDESMNALTVKYGDLTAYKDNTEYKNKHLYNEDGTMVFRYTIKGDINKLMNKAHQPQSSGGTGVGNGTGGSGSGNNISDIREAATDFKIDTAIGVDSQAYELGTGQANPTGSADFQRMVISHEISGERKPTRGEPGAVSRSASNGGTGKSTGEGVPCGNQCGWDSDGFKLNASPSVNIRYNNGKANHNMIINYTYMEMGTFLPTCDLSVPQFNYKTCTSNANCTSQGFDPLMFVGAGCCSRILDESHHVYKTYCNNTCTQSTYSPVCKGDGSSTNKTEVLKLHEATNPDGEENYICIYDNNEEVSVRLENTYKKKDSVGNNYAHQTLLDNEICTISCKEDWDFKLPNLENHLGANAVVAGQYFVLYRDDVVTKGERTCVTTKIDIEKWQNDVCRVSDLLVKAFNQENVSEMFDSIVKSGSDGGLLDDLEYSNTDHSYCENGFKKKQMCGNHCHSDGSNCNKHKHSCDSDDGDSCSCHDYYDEDECEGGGSPQTCTDLTKVDGPTISYSYYSFSCSSGFNTTEGTYKVSDDDIPANFTAGSLPGQGTCKTGDDAITQDNYKDKRGAALKEKAKKEYKRISKIDYDGHLKSWKSYSKERDKLLSDMKTCQFWAMDIRNNNKILSVDDTKFKVQTEFNPQITYSYDESGFMDQLASHNTLQKKDIEYVFTSDYYNKDGFNASAYSGNVVKSNKGVYKVAENSTAQSDALIKGTGLGDYLKSEETGKQLYSWCTNGGEGTRTSKGGKTGEGAGRQVSWSKEAGCGQKSQKYIKNAYYIKRTASLLSEYDADEYRWYIDTVNGFRQLATSAKQAASLTKSSNKDSSKWSAYGVDEKSRDMVFPISETTPRNIYQYAFTFYNVGNYNDNSQVNLGRIMGTNKSVIGNNNRVCFYEVIEGVCYCCGDVLETELVTPAQASTRELLNKDINGMTKSSGNNLTCIGDRCNQYLESYVMSDVITEEKLEENKYDARYGVTINSVSLNSIQKDAGRTLGANWYKDQHYTLEGFVYATDKGAQLLANIEEKGENIYDTVTSGKNQNYPEYSYTLSPKALSIIRDNNTENGYQEQSKSMILYGVTKMHSDSTKSWNASASEPSIAHYASKFLNDTVKAYETPEYKNRVLSRLLKNSNPICYVVGYDGKSGFVFGSKGNVYKGNGERAASATDCRWIDYVGVVRKADDQTKNNDGKLADGKQYYRLSFK